MAEQTKIVIGTRGSKLALWQAEWVADRLRRRYPDRVVEVHKVVTSGDKVLDVPLAKIGGKGLFTKELETAMLAGEIDLAVHSLKDLPTVLPDGLCLAAVAARGPAHDVLVAPRWRTLAALPSGARIGTSSLRRQAQLRHYRPDLVVEPLRGNLDTRLAKLASQDLDGIVLAAAGLQRLGWEKRITEVIPFDICLPAVGQGVLAIETRADGPARQLVAFLHHHETGLAVAAERACLSVLGGGCQVPIGVYGTVQGDTLSLTGVVASLDGRQAVRQQVTGAASEAAALGRELGRRLLACGGRKILAAILP